MNTAVLAKIYWLFLKDANSLWSLVLRGKYSMFNWSKNTFMAKSISSIIWRGIVQTTPLLRKHICQSVWNSMTINFWEDFGCYG